MLNEFRAGSVLSRGFSVWLQNIVPFTLLTLIIYSPLLIYTYSVASEDLTMSAIERWDLFYLLGGQILKLIATACVVYGVFQQLRGRHAGMVDCMSGGLKRLFPVLFIGILVMLCVSGPVVLAAMAGEVIFVLVSVVIAIIIYLILYVAVPVGVVEQPGIVASLSRSRELTAGCRWTIFGVLFVIGAIEWVVRRVTQEITAGNITSLNDIKTFMYALVIMTIVLGALSAVINAVVYHDLRSSKEGVGIDELARVFE